MIKICSAIIRGAVRLSIKPHRLSRICDFLNSLKIDFFYKLPAPRIIAELFFIVMLLDFKNTLLYKL